jgi:hypothetical protein
VAVERGTEVATALIRVLEGTGPVVLLATVWHDAYKRLTERDPNIETVRSVAALFRAGTVVDVPSTFTPAALEKARQVGNADASLNTAMETTDTAQCSGPCQEPQGSVCWRDTLYSPVARGQVRRLQHEALKLAGRVRRAQQLGRCQPGARHNRCDRHGDGDHLGAEPTHNDNRTLERSGRQAAGRSPPTRLPYPAACDGR